MLLTRGLSGSYPGQLIRRSFSCPTRSAVPGLSSRLGSGTRGKPRELVSASATPLRNFSNSSKWERALYSPASPLSSRLATGVWVLIGGSLLYYIWRKRKRTKSQQNNKDMAEGSARLPQQGQFSGKTVLITGAAGDIGGATAAAFAKRGATLILADLPSTRDALVKKCSELEDLGAAKSFHVAVDMTSAEDVEKMTKFATEKSPNGRIDCFFNNAGIQGVFRPLYEQSDDSFLKVMHVNAYGVFLGMKHVGNAMRNSGGGGVIVNTASLAGLLGPPNMAAYAASKFAVVGMTKTGAKDFAPYEIRVCAIAPGILEGKMWDSQVKGQAECLKRLAGDETEASEEELKIAEQTKIGTTPLKRLGKLSEVASVVTFLCSDDASYLTGIVIPIDGGKLP